MADKRRWYDAGTLEDAIRETLEAGGEGARAYLEEKRRIEEEDAAEAGGRVEPSGLYRVGEWSDCGMRKP